jgi:hypothetical protein
MQIWGRMSPLFFQLFADLVFKEAFAVCLRATVVVHRIEFHTFNE